jgi:hypothetical protein
LERRRPPFFRRPESARLRSELTSPPTDGCEESKAAVELSDPQRVA